MSQPRVSINVPPAVVRPRSADALGELAARAYLAVSRLAHAVQVASLPRRESRHA